MKEITNEHYEFLQACAALSLRVEYGLPTDNAVAAVRSTEAAWMASRQPMYEVAA